MPTFPDDHQPHHDGSRRLAPVPDQQVTLLAMVKRFSRQGWQILRPGEQLWEAFRQSGSASRTIVANSALALYGKLAEADESADAAASGTYPDPAARYLADLDRLGRIGTGR